MTLSDHTKPVVLCIMDGWGIAPPGDMNAVSSAHTPIYDGLLNRYPHATLEASGPAVGLPEGQPGNSEVGHMNIGAGRCVLQDLPRIHQAIEDNQFANIKALKDFISSLQDSGGRAHIIGLFSTGGVHAHSDHSLALVDILSRAGIEVVLHAITDGRDTLPKIACQHWESFEEKLSHPITLGSVIGRYYAMDRDNRHERTQAAFDVMASGTAPYRASSFIEAIEQAYVRGEGDEFIQATLINDYSGMQSGDGIFMTNFRVDRARQILTALMSPEVIGRTEQDRPENLHYLTMTPVFSDDPALPYCFGPQDLSDGLGETVAKAGLRQLRLAETEKYPHVTYFFNGGEETPFANEDRNVIPSPKVATYDLAPMMSAQDVRDRALKSLSTQEHDLLIINFANPDMVGHTGDIDAARKAVQTVDSCVGALCEAVISAGGAMIVTADHGNCEVMWDEDAQCPHTAHTTNLVPVILVGRDDLTISAGCLADLAPSLLTLLGVALPQTMTGKNLLAPANKGMMSK